MTEGIYILVGATLLYLRVILVKILRDIKEDMESQKLTDTVATAETFKWIHATLPGIPQSELTADDVSPTIAAYIGTVVSMDKNSSELLQQLTKIILEPPSESEE